MTILKLNVPKIKSKRGRFLRGMVNLKYSFSGIGYAMDLRKCLKWGIFSTLVHAYIKRRI